MSKLEETNHSEKNPWLDEYASESAIRAVARGLLDKTWPEAEWKHREHCIATLGLILFHPEIDIDRELPGIIQRYNIAQGGQNTDTSGYHHSMTVLYLNAIRHFVQNLPEGTAAGDAVKSLLASPIAKKEYPLRYYSRELIMSTRARRDWVEPDLAEPDFPIRRA